MLLLGFVRAMKYPSKFESECKYNDINIAFKFHNFVQVDLLTSM